MARPVKTDRFAGLDRAFYTPIEIAYMLNLKVATIRGYLKQPSEKHKDRTLLVGKKHNRQWRVSKNDLIIFFDELYGD